MSKGKRYETEGTLNYQKVFAVVIALLVIIMCAVIIINVFTGKKRINKNNEYFALYANQKWGIINQDGEELIKPTYQEMIVIPDKKKEVFICTYNVNEETGEYSTKAINSQNEQIFNEYDGIEAISNFDKNDNVWYEENVLKVSKAGKYGLINLDGKELLACEYDDIEVLPGIENSLIISKEGKKGLANDKGSVIIEPNYKEIKNLGETYKEGYITITEDNKYGIISTTKKQLLENKYEEIEQIYIPNYYLIKEAGKTKLINSSGETIIETGFDEIKSGTSRGIIFVQNGMYGEKDTTGINLIEPKYQDLKEAKEGIYIAKQNDKYGIIDTIGNEKIQFEYQGISYNEKADIFLAETEDYQTTIIDSQFNKKATGIISEINTENEYIKIRENDENKYYDFKCEEKPNTEILKNNTLFLSKQNGKYGYVDKKGNTVVENIYDDATEQNECGYAAVKKDGLWGAIDQDGNVVIEPKYNLNNNLKIDFIGKWHLGEDLNMNYYCEK